MRLDRVRMPLDVKSLLRKMLKIGVRDIRNVVVVLSERSPRLMKKVWGRNVVGCNSSGLCPPPRRLPMKTLKGRPAVEVGGPQKSGEVGNRKKVVKTYAWESCFWRWGRFGRKNVENRLKIDQTFFL